MRYAVVIERTETNSSVYVPDLSGCAWATVTISKTEVRDTIRFHVEGLKEYGKPVPAATTIAEYKET